MASRKSKGTAPRPIEYIGANVIPFPSPGPTMTNVKREHIARNGVQPAVCVCYDQGATGFVVIEVLAPAARALAVVAALTPTLFASQS